MHDRDMLDDGLRLWWLQMFGDVREPLTGPLQAYADAIDGLWQHAGFTSGPIIGIDYGVADAAESAVLAWPLSGQTVSLDVPRDDRLRALFDALAVAHQADLELRLLRLANDIGHYEPHVRYEFTAVQQILKDAGISDGYGRLTLRQPVRPPVELPDLRHAGGYGAGSAPGPAKTTARCCDTPTR
ncbi:hypothetical protein ACIPEL_36215 [Streptomyces griseoviridis]